MTETESIVIHDPAPLEERFPVVRAQAEHLASPLSPEDQTVQSMPDASPTKWHRAHTSWFFELFLLQSSERAPARNPYQCYDESFAYLFNSYYETVGARHPRPERGLVSRPGVAEVSAYRVHVDEAMSVLLAEEQDKAMTELVELGLHHEQQHQELLLMDIKHALFCNPVHPRYLEQEVRALASASNGTIQTQAWNEHEGGLIEIGHQGGGFAFDNELPRHAVFLGPFAVGTALVTCGQWVEFMADGGYQRPELWLSDGWSTVQEQRWRSPLYWSRVDDEWWEFTLHGGRPVRFAQPVVHVSYYEADAFARWAGFRLPTEAEWEASAIFQGKVGRFLEPGDTRPELHPRAFKPGGSGYFGEVWQWTSTAYGPYPGFQPAPGAVGEYNGKFMVNQMVLRGGSCITPADHLRYSYRNFFAPPTRWAFSGVRLARDL